MTVRALALWPLQAPLYWCLYLFIYIALDLVRWPFFLWPFSPSPTWLFRFGGVFFQASTLRIQQPSKWEKFETPVMESKHEGPAAAVTVPSSWKRHLLALRLSIGCPNRWATAGCDLTWFACIAFDWSVSGLLALGHQLRARPFYLTPPLTGF